MSDGKEYRVVYKRAGMAPKRKRYATLKAAERFIVLLGPEPWTAYPHHYNMRGPDEVACCSGYECGYGGLTVRESLADYRANMPPLEWARIECRDIGRWAARTAVEA